MQKSSVIKAALLGGALALGSALSGSASDALARMCGTTRFSGVSFRAKRSFGYRKVCTSSQKTRNPADPQQAYLIERAKAKRARRAEKLRHDSARSYLNNCCTVVHPFHIAK